MGIIKNITTRMFRNRCQSGLILITTKNKQAAVIPKMQELWHISASEGAEFTERIKEYVKKLKELGPNPLKEAARLNYLKEIQA